MLIVLGCNNKKEVTPTSTKIDKPKGAISPKNETFDFKGYKINIVSNPLKDSTTVTITKNKEVLITKDLRGAFRNKITADLNKDGNEELFIATNSAKKNNDLAAFSFFDYGPMEIYKREFRKMDEVSNSIYTVEYNQLIEEYNDKSASNKSKKLYYNILAGEAGFYLQPEGWSPQQRDELEGFYAAQENKKLGEYKTLNFNKNDDGSWEAIVKVKKISDKSVLCEFRTVGHFIDKNFYGPMGFLDPSIKGNLEIFFLDNSAIIYTADKKDYKTMAVVCDNKTAIAGTFKKTSI